MYDGIIQDLIDEFGRLPGIGPKLAARIISFREKLGGFYDVTQVAETFGLPDSTFQKIKSRLRSDGQVLRKMDLNTATEDERRMNGGWIFEKRKKRRDAVI